jgi:adenosine kinase
MHFPGRFSEHILSDKLESISFYFQVDSFILSPGGISTNIAYNLALLGERPRVMGTVGKDFDEHREWLEQQGVDTSAIKTIDDQFTASFFVTTDELNAQIASFYTGAMARASELQIAELNPPAEVIMVSPNDPTAMAQYVQECVEGEIPFYYDPSQQIIRMEPDDLRFGLQHCSALFANDYELSLIEERTSWTLSDIRSKSSICVITRGNSGSDIYQGDDEWHIPVVEAEKIADPTGVGDAFRGGFLKGYLNGLPLISCGRMGALAATYCLESYGPQGHSYDLQSFLQRFRDNFGEDQELTLLEPDKH